MVPEQPKRWLTPDPGPKPSVPRVREISTAAGPGAVALPSPGQRIEAPPMPPEPAADRSYRFPPAQPAAGRRSVPHAACLSGRPVVQRTGPPGQTPGSVCDGGHGSPFVGKLRRRSGPPTGVLTRRSRSRIVVGQMGVVATARGRSGLKDCATFAVIHGVPTGCPPLVHSV